MSSLKDNGAFKKAFGLLVKTTPFLGLNIIVYGGFFLAAVLWLGIFGGIAVFFSSRIELLTIIFFIIAVAGPFAVLAFGKRYLLYLVKGAHIAVLTKYITEGEIPEGKSQIAYGREIVQQNFRDVSILFALNKMTDRVVRRFTRRFVRIVDMLPLGGGATKIARWASTIVNQSLSYIDEAILSYAIAKDGKNVWTNARHGIILYAQVYKPVLMTALKVWFLGKAFFMVLIILLGIPGIILMMMFDTGWFQVITIISVFLLSSLIIRAVFDPFATAYTLVTYHQSIDGVEVNAEWDERLRSVSGTFRQMTDRAKDFAGQNRTGEIRTDS
ncbi:MAG: hypothetical protein EA391_06885 [Balneolaceae bacterium]|nr:MAG: hypothetical protein EA391_06885 [Balneolaceae bacterium]